MVEEVEYLRVGSTVVTSTRIEIGGQTFAVRNVGSVKVTQARLPWIAILFGILFALSGIAPLLAGSIGMGLFLLGVGGVLLYSAWKKMATRRLVLVSGGGEVNALESTNAQAVETVRAAIASAISAR